MPDYKVRGIPRKEPDLILDMDEQGFAYTVGISFPPYPVVGEKCLRTDIRGGMWFIWNGTYWLSEQMFSVPLLMLDNRTTTLAGYLSLDTDVDVYLQRAVAVVYPTSVGANYFSLIASKRTHPGNVGTNLWTQSLTAATSGQWNGYAVTLNHLVAVATYRMVTAEAIQTGTPTAIYGSIVLDYRLRVP